MIWTDSDSDWFFREKFQTFFWKECTLFCDTRFKIKYEVWLQISKFKALYCAGGDLQNTLFTELLNLYYPVVQWDTVKLMLILQYIIGLNSQIIDFTNAFAQADIPSG